MAFMFPDVIAVDNSPWVKKTYYLLSRLPEDCLVYYEPLIARKYPHFIVIMPSVGVLLVEVCDWRGEQIETIGDADAVVTGKVKKLPRVKAADYLGKLLRRCRKDGRSDQLLQKPDGGKEQFSIPFAYAVVLPYIDSEQLAQSPFVATENAITSDRFSELQDQAQSPEQMLEACKAFFVQKWPDSLTCDVVSELRALFHPEIEIAPPPYGGGQTKPTPKKDKPDNSEKPAPTPKPAPAPRARPAGKSLKVLDLEQEQAAISLGSGHRLLWGVAGSGKTIILIARAKFLAKANPKAQILVTCFNVTLANYLKSALEGLEDQITVKHFHKLASDEWKIRFDPKETPEQYSERLRMQAAAAKAPSKFDMILVDEAQDFDPAWFSSLLTLMKDPVRGDFVIVGDGTQGIYKSRKISWKSLGIQAKGRTTYFKKNYRNSREIIELAAKFGRSGSADSGDEASVESVVLSPDCAVRSSGIKPVFVRGSQEEAGKQVVAMIEQLQSGMFNGYAIEPLRPCEIAVMYAANEGVSECLKAIRSGLRKDMTPVLIMYNKEQKEKVCSPDLKVLTIYSAKGLQYKAVFLLGVDALPRDTEEFPVEADEKLMYVALTRAEDYLVTVAGDKNSLFANRIAEAVSEGLVEEYRGEA